MTRPVLLSAVLIPLALIAGGDAAEPLVGTWRLDHQELNAQNKDIEPLTLRISPDGDKLLFAFAVPVNNIDFVSMTYTAKLDGSEAEVKNAQRVKVGTVQITRAKPSQYKFVLKGGNGRESAGHLTVSPDGKTLTSESDSTQGGQPLHLLQSFSRH
jgi:Tol biopolymer transport system component